MSRADERSAARLAVVQALYQMDVTGKGLNEILAEFESFWIGREVEGDEYKPAELAFFRDVLAGVLKEQRAIDPLIDRTLAEGWPLRRVEAVMRAVLRAGTYELKERADVPARVVITEYVAVASAFFDREEAGMTNAVLDRLARLFRPGELDEKVPRFSA
jgi:N utilization substance protein B